MNQAMNMLLDFLLHFIFIATFVFLYVVSVIIIRPFRKHKLRNYSTIFYKLTYLLYLATFIILSYLVLFYSSPNYQAFKNTDPVYKIYYGIVIYAFIVPNFAIMFRRKAENIRRFYNIFFGSMNFMVSIALLYILFTVSWNI